MQKSEFVEAVAGRAELSRAEAGRAVDACLDTITERLAAGDEVGFTGFGKFSTGNRAARQGVNPQTQQPLHIPAARVPKFSAGSQLKAAVRG